MSSLFKKPRMPDPPKPVRMPVETDPEVLEAGKRARASAMRRQGRLSTILTDSLRQTTGSSGQKLGA